MNKINALRLVILAAIWGSSFLFMKIGVPVFGPVTLIELRVGLAAVFLWCVFVWMKKRFLFWHYKKHFFIIGLFNSALPFLLFAYAAQTLTASLLAILNSAAPIFGALMSAVWLRSRMSLSSLLGLCLGVCGVVVLVLGSVMVKNENWIWPLLAGIIAPACYGVASVYAKTAKVSVDAMENAHGSMWASTLLLLPIFLFSPVRQVPLLKDWLALFALAILCTGIAYLIFFKLIEEVGVVGALSVTFLIPVFGVLWAYLFLDEVVGWFTLLGGAMVLLGTAFTNGVFDQVFNLFYSKIRKFFKGA